MSRFTACLLLIGGVVSAADNVSLEKRLPSDVLFYFSCSNVAETIADARKTSIGKVIDDPSLKELKDQIRSKYQEASDKVKEETGASLQEICSLFQGEVSVGVFRPLNMPVGVAASIEIGDREELLNSLISKIEEQAGDNLVTSTEVIEGSTVNVWTIHGGSDSEGNPQEHKLYWLVRDQTLVACFGDSLINQVLTRWDGSNEDSFANNEVYSTIMSKCRTNADEASAFSWYLDPIGAITAGLSASPETQIVAISFNAFLPSLGLNKVKAIGGTTELATADFDAISKTMYYVDMPATGLLKAFEFRQTVEGPSDWVPDTATTYFAFDWNVAEAYNAISTTADSFMGQRGAFESRVNTMIQRVDGVQLKLKDDIVDTFSGNVEFYMTTPESTNPEDFEGIVALGLQDEAKALKLLSLTPAAKDEDNITELDGSRVQLFDIDGVTSAAAIRDNVLYLTKKQEQLALPFSKKADRPLNKSEGYQAVAKHFPGKASSLSYSDIRKQIQVAYEQLRNGEFDGLSEGEFDASKLPEFERIKHYFTYSGSYVVPDEQGVLNVSFMTKGE